MKIGFIGLGTMGGPMAKNLLKSGHELIVFNRSPERADVFRNEAKATTASSIAETAGQAEVLFTMLSDNAAIESAYFGGGGVVGTLAGSTNKPRAVIDCSTISPEVSIRVAERLAQVGVEFLDAPVTGSEPQAIEGSLTFIVGGKKETFEQFREVLLAMGKKALHMGDNGTGSQAKLANNTLSAINLLAVAESLRMVQKAGIDPHLFLEVVAGGGARSGMAEMKGPKILKGDFTANFMAQLMHKDLGLALQLAQSLELQTPMLETAKKQFNLALEKGLGKEDMCSVFKLY